MPDGYLLEHSTPMMAIGSGDDDDGNSRLRHARRQKRGGVIETSLCPFVAQFPILNYFSAVNGLVWFGLARLSSNSLNS